ncbi:MAG: hypothetical protein ABR588_03250 [Sphingomicrobium sp.]|nr:hypothetical protein [Sphingomonadales bacterium]
MGKAPQQVKTEAPPANVAVPRRRPSSAPSPRPWPLAIIGLGAVAVAAFLLDRAISPPPPAMIAPPPPLVRPVPVVVAPPIASAGATASATAPALSRAAREKSAAAAPHPMPEQLRAAQQLADARRAEIRREEAAQAVAPPPPTPAFSPSLAPSGQVVQLGTYATAREAEAAAQRFRFRYRGLLDTLPKAVLPYRPAGGHKSYYRVQFVAPNQAYAEVTCQRLRAAHKTCIVIY